MAMLKHFGKFVGMVALSLAALAVIFRFAPLPENIKGYFRP